MQTPKDRSRARLPVVVNRCRQVVMGWCWYFKSVYRFFGIQINVPNCSLLFTHATCITMPLKTLTRRLIMLC